MNFPAILAGAMRAVGAVFGRTNAPAAVEPVPLIQEAEEDDGLTVEERLEIELAEAAWDNVAIGRMLQARADTAALSGTDPVIGASILDRIPEERRQGRDMAALVELATPERDVRQAMAREIRERELEDALRFPNGSTIVLRGLSSPDQTSGS